MRGIAVPVYQDAIASELAYVLEHAETSVIVAEDQLSLAIGKKGQNVRLATRLVGWDIEIMTQEELAQAIDRAVTATANDPTRLEAIRAVIRAEAAALLALEKWLGANSRAIVLGLAAIGAALEPDREHQEHVHDRAQDRDDARA